MYDQFDDGRGLYPDTIRAKAPLGMRKTIQRAAAIEGVSAGEFIGEPSAAVSRLSSNQRRNRWNEGQRMKPQQAVALVLPCPSSPEGSADEQSSREIQGQPMQPLRKPTAPEPRAVEVKHQADERGGSPATMKPAAGPHGSRAHLYGVRPRPNGEPIRSGDLVLGAARIEAEAACKRDDPLNSFSRKYAADLRDRVATAPEYMTEIGVGGELVPASILGENSRALQFADTVQNPNYVTVDASRDRLDLARGGRPGIRA